MGGSLGLALKEYRICRKVVGLVRRIEAIQEAKSLGVVDFATTDPDEALSDADVIVFATPVRAIIKQLPEFALFYKPNAIITDMGSTKQQILQAMEMLPSSIQPVGSHPMCGKELTGMIAAEANLYHNAPWIISPASRTTAETIATVQTMAEAIGAKPHILSADRHDKLVATVSHLPYTLSTALVLAAQQVAEDDPFVWNVTASGFKDTSRIAASEVTMMLDILLTNRQAVGDMLALARSQLDQFIDALAVGDEDTLRNLMEKAAAQRKRLY